MRGFGWIAICAIINICMANIDQDIAKNKDKLATAKSQEKAISKKLDVLGKAINAKNSELTQLGNQINALEKDIEQNQGKSLSQEKSLKDSQKKQNVLVEQKLQIEKQLIKLIAQGIAFNMVISRSADIDSVDGVVQYHIYQILHKNARNSIKTLNAKHNLLNNEIKQISNAISQIQSSIKTQTNKKERLQIAKEQQKATLAKMQTELKTYDQQLKDIVKERKSLDEILDRKSVV